MKNSALVLLIAAIAFASCKKSSDSNQTPAPTGNYVKINNDMRQLGDIPSSNVTVTQNNSNPGYTELVISMTQQTNNIDNTNNTYLILFVMLKEDPAGTEYPILNMGSPPPTSASVSVVLQGNTGGTQMTGNGGKLYVTRNSNNTITSLKFDNVDMKGTYEATVSASIVIK